MSVRPRDSKYEKLATALPRLAGDRDGLRAAGRTTDLVEVPAGYVLIEEDVPGTEVFVLVRGAVDVVRNGRVQATLIPTASFGEHNLFDLAGAGAVTRNPSELIVVDRRAFKPLLRQTPGLALHILESLTHRLEAAEHALLRLRCATDRKPYSEVHTARP